MIWWTLPLFVGVATGIDYLLSKFKTIVSGTLEEKLALILLAPVFAPVVEELAFRWMPLKYFGLEGMIIYTGIWIAAHIVWIFFSDHFKIQYTILTILFSAYFCWLWYINMGWLAIILHSLYNTTFCIIAVRREPILANWNFRNPSVPKVLWESKEIKLYRRGLKWIWKIKSLIQN